MITADSRVTMAQQHWMRCTEDMKVEELKQADVEEGGGRVAE